MKKDKQSQSVDLDPRDPAFFKDPYPVYEAIRADMSVFRWKQYDMWCFIDFADVNRLLRDRRFGRQILHVASREEIGIPAAKAHLADFDAVEAYSLLELEPPAHTRLRGLVNRAFVSRQVERLKPEIEALTHRTIDSFQANDGVELISQFAQPIPVSVIARMIGVPQELNAQLLDWSHRMVRMYMFHRTDAIERDANSAAREFAACLRHLIAQRRAAPSDDLLSHMIVTERGGERLSDDELVSTCVLLLNAGHEATVHQTGNAVKTILEKPFPPSDLFADDETTEAAIEETLRFDAPLHMFTRYALQDLELENGIRLRKGDQIGLMLGAANRDPRRFHDADQFLPNRQDQDNVTFGAGIHFCIGAPLARLELQVSIPILFDRLPNLRFRHRPDYRDAYHFHGLDRLDLIWG